MTQPIVKFSQEFMDEFSGSYQELLAIKHQIQNGDIMEAMISASYDTDGFSSIIEFNLQ